MSGSMNRNPSSQAPDNNKDGRKDVFNLTVGGQKVSSTQQSFSTFTPQDEPDFTEVLSKRNVRKQQKQQQQQIPRQHTMTTRSSNTGPQVIIEQQNYDKSAYQQAASSVSSRRPQGGSQFQTTPPNESVMINKMKHQWISIIIKMIINNLQDNYLKISRPRIYPRRFR
ncbi:unnamed protein product [Rhizophagus irregularis]|nr:unnamed protein product [Rhizophagus irregularis]